jgi:acyl-CoA hydrolase
METKNEKWVTPDEAVKVVQSGNRVFVHGMGATPRRLLEALAARASELRGVEFLHLHLEGDAPHANPSLKDSFFVNNLFIGGNLRSAVNEGRADYIPVFLSEIPSLFRRDVLPLDVAIVSVSTPDRHGYCSLGVSVDVALAAVQTAKIVIAQVNPNMPRTHGDGNIHVSKFTHLVQVDDPLQSNPPSAISDVERTIGQIVAAQIDDGACLQMGIGAIPNAILAALTNHRRLGIHTEMFSDGVIPLVEKA